MIAFTANDWGSSSVRVTGVDGQGNLVGTRQTAIGLADAGVEGFPAVFRRVAGDWAEAPAIFCGMAGARGAWAEAPYAACPVKLPFAASTLMRFEMWPGRMGLLVPGLSCRHDDGTPDIMRGEETQLAGLIATGMRDGVVCLPGTHSKWALLEGSSVPQFRTMMTGDVFAALSRHTVLARSFASNPSGAAPKDKAFDAGVRAALGGCDVLARLFGLRARFIVDGAAGEAISAELSGLLIGHEFQAMRRIFSCDALVIVGAPELAALYGRAASLAGISAEVTDGNAMAAKGLVALARQAGLIAGEP